MCLARLRIGYSYSIDNIPSQILEMASGIITLHTDIPLDGNCLALYSLPCFCISMVTDPPIKHQWLLASLDQSNTGCRSVAANPLILRSQALESWDPCSGSVGSLLLDLATGFNRPSLTNRKAPNSVRPGNLVYTEKPKTITRMEAVHGNQKSCSLWC